MSMVQQETQSRNLPSSTETNPRDYVKSISITVETNTTPIRRIGPGRYAVLGSQNSKLFFVPSQAIIPFPNRLFDDCCDEEEGSYRLNDLDAYSIRTTLLDDALPPKEKDPWSFTLTCYVNNLYFIVLDIPEDIKTPLILGRPFLSTAHVKIDVFQRKITLRDNVEYKGKNIVGAFINVPIFVGYFSVITDFAAMENMDAYHDEGIGDIILERPFCKEAHIKARRFDGMITIYNGNDSVTYQMA
nr:hypothetical protein [Tanacetum cinerariifolium]